MTITERYKTVVERFSQEMPHPKPELQYTNAFELLVAVILSAQCTDKRVNMVTPGLLRAYPTPETLAKATQEDVYDHIKSVSYPNNKAKSLIGMADALVKKFNGEVPDTLDELVTLPGVGRKTANVILAVIFGQPTMAVDTHVFRVSERIGLTSGAKTPLETERTLIRHLPPEAVADAHHWLILHGRYVCKARKPDCRQCCIADVCRYHSLHSSTTDLSPIHIKKTADTTR